MIITVKPGDTLWSLAAKHLHDPLQWSRIFKANRAAIEGEQRKFSARRNMRGPDWIFPGTLLVIL